MNKSLFCIFLALTISGINAFPAQAASKKAKTAKPKKQLIVSSGQWCFELPQMGLFCYDS